MKILKIIIVTISLGLSLSAWSQKQDTLGFDYEDHQGTTILLPTWNNIFNTITMPDSIFMELMDLYKYKFIDEKGYYWKMSEGEDSHFYIEHELGFMRFVWKNSTIKTSDLESMLQSEYVKTKPDGTKIFQMMPDEDNKVEIQILNTKQLGMVSVDFLSE
ncbi:MAG TPA: hypothetical protein PLP06_03165 [Saprospiraceae bacterium]|nr:hypothetical protein [Saprospiraceae bacterium]